MLIRESAVGKQVWKPPVGRLGGLRYDWADAFGVAFHSSRGLNALVECEGQEPKPAPMQDEEVNPRRHLAPILALLWIFPSAGAMLILLDQPSSKPQDTADNWWLWIQSIRLEHWVAALILLIHAYLATKAFRIRRRESNDRANS